MGYESRVYIVNRVSFVDNSVWGEELGSLRLGKMADYSWIELFNKPKDFTLWEANGNTEITKDSYGDSLKYAELDDVLKWLEEHMEERHYRRDKMLYDLLKGFKDDTIWGREHIVVVHYGY